jgi:hypothetical protein
MTPPLKFCCVLALLTLAASAPAQQWFSLSGRDTAPDATVVEVDLQTVRLREGSGEAVIRVTHDVLQPHPAGFGYRSFVATANIDCARRTVALASAAYFALPAGRGARVGADSSGRDGGMPAKIAEGVPVHSVQALLRAACPAGAS